MNYIKRTFKNKTEWLKARGVGGSDLAAICGKSKWMTVNDVFKRFRGKDFESPENELMKRGSKAEDCIRKLFQLDHPHYKVTAPPRNGHWIFTRKDNDLMTVTPDGIFKDENGKKYGLEIKYCDLISSSSKGEWSENQIPMQYYFQCLQYLIVMDDLDGVCLRAHLKHYRKNLTTDNWEFEHAEQREYWIYRTDAIENRHLEYAERKEIDFIENSIRKGIRPKTTIRF